MCVCVCVCVLCVRVNPSLHHEQDAKQAQFLNGEMLIGIQDFPSPRLVALSSLKECSLFSSSWG